jgi:autotransporter-associated beta strand protein
MKPSTTILAVSMMLTAVAPWQTRAAENLWNNSSANSLWDLASANWTLPTIWSDGDDAIFGPTGAGTVMLGGPITAQRLNFTAAGYTLEGNGNALTLAGASPTLTATEDVTIAASIVGENGLVIQGSKTIVLAGDASLPDANHYTGGTYIRSGTLILQAAGAGNGAAAGSPHAVDSIEALDTGATLKFGTTFDDSAPIASQWVSAPGEQIGARIPGTRMVMTGGTLDLNNDPKNEVIRVPEGFGLIVNNGSSVQAGLNVIMDGLDHTFSGVIADGNNGVLTGDNFANGATPQGPGYQIGIVSISGTAGSTWTLAGDNTYSGSTRIDGGTIVKLAGNHSLGIPTLTGSLTGPLRIQNGSALDLNGRDQTLALMTAGQPGGKIYNSAPGTVSTLTVGYGNEQAGRNAPYQLMDNTGTGGLLALRKINTQPYDLVQSNITTLEATTTRVTGCTQGLRNDCVATYSGDTSIESGTLDVQGLTAISPNSAYRITTTGAFGPGVLKLSYEGDALCRQLWIDGVQQPNGTYGAGTAGIDQASTGTITVTGFAPATISAVVSGGKLNLSWSGVYKLQSSINNILGPYQDQAGAELNTAVVTMNPEVGAVYYRLATY